MKTAKTKYVCSVYSDRPLACIEYPWNFANSIFRECIFVDHTAVPVRLRSMEEQLKIHIEKEISEYCVACGMCCFYGPAACSKLQIINQHEPQQSDE